MPFKNREYQRKYKKQYYINNKDNIKEKARKYHMKNREDRNLYSKEWQLNNREYVKQYRIDNKERFSPKKSEWNLKRLYGISMDDYNRMFNEQSGCCLICGTHQNDIKKKLNVDHCHVNGKIRGLLCPKCNKGIGLFNDNIDILNKAIIYLQK